MSYKINDNSNSSSSYYYKDDTATEREKQKRVERYFSIGQENDRFNQNYCWIWDGVRIIAVQGGKHGVNFGHNISDNTFKGWYDIDKNIISFVFPKKELDKFGDKKPTKSDIPKNVYQALIKRFGKNHPKIAVFENTIKRNQLKSFIIELIKESIIKEIRLEPPVDNLPDVNETMTYNDLLKLADKGRKDRSKNVKVRSIPVSLEDGKESWNFSYKSDPSVTDNPFRGSIKFFKEIKSKDNENVADLPCKVDCSCPDYLYRWAWNNASQNAGEIGPKSLNKCINRRPKPAYYHGEGICKHLIALSGYLKTKIMATRKSNLFEAINEVAKQGPFNITYYD